MTRTVFIRGWDSERSFQATIEAELRRLGYLVASVPDSRRVTGRGVPDILFAGHGIAGCLEVKAAAGRLRPEQLAWIKALFKAGMYATVVYPEDWDVVRQELTDRAEREGA